MFLFPIRTMEWKMKKKYWFMSTKNYINDVEGLFTE